MAQTGGVPEEIAPRVLREIVLIDDPVARPAALNMAIDEVLLTQEVETVLRVYRWDAPVATLGYFDRWEEVKPRVVGRHVVRRWTGGGVVFHGEDWPFSLIVPKREELAGLTAAASYCVVHTALAAALRSVGIEAIRAGEGTTRGGFGCFERPVAADVMTAGVKVAGGAQRRTRSGLLHQGSLQGVSVSDDFAMLLARRLAEKILMRMLTQDELAVAEAVSAARYATAEWTQRF